ncbi:ribosomal protein S18 acetylase RimI-like enzyme [Streptomyces sp. PvR006]|uniref:GNAT family N-acetyltransferase n=1 Tax=Streptomyces sp. PvR006 TaxID=2817860 RepID=UPI001AE707AB|nr:GNAT family N-acetyltransferase [Streptomyces sp. PvR006]MBP2585729.1 ribosomal protein S18 acetylase RimI-like enzyme [Streptomyces sp. PvR006]
MTARIEENRSHARLPDLLAAYHLVNQAEKGTAVETAAQLPAVYRAEVEDPAGAFAADTVLLATPPGEDLPAGCVVLKAPSEGRAPEIKRLWVAPEARRKGLAQALMSEALRRAAASGAGAVRLTVWNWRDEPLALYRALGFETVASWDERPDLLCLEKPFDVIGRLTPDAVRAHASDGLAALLLDAVDSGASVGFLASLTASEAAAWWTRAAEEAAGGARDVWAAHGPGGSLTGVVTLVRGGAANGAHRGEIARLLVHRSARGRGLGRRLLATAEAHAAATGLGLLVLDTQTDSPAERLYRGAGWTAAGTIPDFAADPAGVLRATTLYYKLLG